MRLTRKRQSLGSTMLRSANGTRWIDQFGPHCDNWCASGKSTLCTAIATRLIRWLSCLRSAEGVIPLATAHGWISNTLKEKFYCFLDRRFLARFPKVIAVSEPIRQALIRIGAPAERVVRIANGIDSDTFRRRTGVREEMRRALGIPLDACVLGAVGRLSREKRFDLLLDAAVRLQNGSSLYVVIAGEGSCSAALAQQALNLGLGDRCLLLGQRNDVREVHQVFDVYVQSSDTEGISNTVLEAMAARDSSRSDERRWHQRIDSRSRARLAGPTARSRRAGKCDQLHHRRSRCDCQTRRVRTKTSGSRIVLP